MIKRWIISFFKDDIEYLKSKEHYRGFDKGFIDGFCCGKIKLMEDMKEYIDHKLKNLKEEQEKLKEKNIVKEEESEEVEESDE